MADHVLIVTSGFDVETDMAVELWCESCDVRLCPADRVSPSLDELNRLADEHITDAERAERKRD